MGDRSAAAVRPGRSRQFYGLPTSRYWAEDPDTGVYRRAAGGPHLAFTWLDACFYAWAFALWLEEMHQWAVDSARGMNHVDDLINIIDVVSLFALLLALVLPLC